VPQLPAWLQVGLLARLEWILAGRHWEAAFPLPGRAAAPPGRGWAALPTILLGLERGGLQQGTRHSRALPPGDALARLAAYRLTSTATVSAAYTYVRKLAMGHDELGPDDSAVMSALFVIARLTAVAICRGARHGMSHAQRRQRMLAGLPQRTWRDRGAMPAGLRLPESDPPCHISASL